MCQLHPHRVVFLVLLFCCSWQGGRGQSFNPLPIDKVMAFIDAHHLAMGTVAIAKDGVIIYSRQIGFASNRGVQKIPANDSTQYMIGSITKMFTAVMTLQLVEEKQLSLQTTLAQFYPKIPFADKITIAMLLGHHSGLPDYTTDAFEKMDRDSLYKTVGFNERPLSTNLGYLVSPISKDSILHVIENGRRHFPPGKGFAYNNSGYWLLSGIVEKVTGQSYQQNLQTRIIQRSGLLHTAAGIHYGKQGNQAKTYYYCDGWQQTADLYLPNARGAGDILSTPTDLIKFITGLYNGQLVSKASRDFMADFYQGDSTRLLQMGYGLESARFGEEIGIGHGGDTYGAHGAVLYFPGRHLSICCLLQGTSPGFDRNDMLELLYDAYLGRKLDFPTTDRYHMSALALKPLLGIYHSDGLALSVRVTRDCRTLRFSPAGQPEFYTNCTAPYSFANETFGLVFKFDSDGKTLHLFQHGKSYLFTKQ